jgi:hypothetical protein
MRAADKITADYMDNKLQQNSKPSSPLLTKTAIDPDIMAFMMAELVPIPPPAHTPSKEETQAEPTVKTSKLVQVKVHNFIIGAEKEAILSRLDASPTSGSLSSPANSGPWRLAEGGLSNTPESPLMFLIPPEFEKMNSGDLVVIELDFNGGLAIARHKL